MGLFLERSEWRKICDPCVISSTSREVKPHQNLLRLNSSNRTRARWERCSRFSSTSLLLRLRFAIAADLRISFGLLVSGHAGRHLPGFLAFERGDLLAAHAACKPPCSLGCRSIPTRDRYRRSWKSWKSECRLEAIARNGARTGVNWPY